MIIEDDYKNYKLNIPKSTMKTDVKTEIARKVMEEKGEAKIRIDTDAIRDILDTDYKEYTNFQCRDGLSKSMLKSYAKEFFESFFGREFDFSVRGTEDKQEGFNQKIKKPTVFDRPVKFKIGKSQEYGKAIPEYELIQGNYRLNRIELSRKATYVTISVLVHELSHGLIERNFDKTREKSFLPYRNYTNQEIPSMFMERLVMDELIEKEKNPEVKAKLENARKIRLMGRVADTVSCIQYAVLMIDSKRNFMKKNNMTEYDTDIDAQDYYTKEPDQNSRNINLDLNSKVKYTTIKIISAILHRRKIDWNLTEKEQILKSSVDSIYMHGMGGLYSYALYDRYRNGDECIKKKIKDGMTKCFLGNAQIEDLLEDEELAINIDKKLIKKYVDENKVIRSELLNKKTARTIGDKELDL